MGKNIEAFPNSLWFGIVDIANKSWRKPIPHELKIVENMHFPGVLVHPELINIEYVPDLVCGLMQDRLSKQKIVIINDGSHGRFIGIFPVTSKKIDVISVNRFGEILNRDIQTITNPIINAKFIGEGNRDFELTITKGGNGGECILTICSDGNMRPNDFIISTEDEVLFGRKDSTGSLTFAQAHLNKEKNSWVVDGKDTRRILRNRSRKKK